MALKAYANEPMTLKALLSPCRLHSLRSALKALLSQEEEDEENYFSQENLGPFRAFERIHFISTSRPKFGPQQHGRLLF